jgi:hypothetical protein
MHSELCSRAKSFHGCCSVSKLKRIQVVVGDPRNLLDRTEKERSGTHSLRVLGKSHLSGSFKFPFLIMLSESSEYIESMHRVRLVSVTMLSTSVLSMTLDDLIVKHCGERGFFPVSG